MNWLNWLALLLLLLFVADNWASLPASEIEKENLVLVL
jgi:hypothetical protein